MGHDQTPAWNLTKHAVALGSWVSQTRAPEHRGWDIPEHSMCEDLLGSCADNHVVVEASVFERGGP
jgi:hypothetical protein